MKALDNIFLISDHTRKSIYIKKKIKKFINLVSPSNASIFLVIGGDGFMLKTLKRYHDYKVPFYGINSGSYGFLMNKFSPKKFITNIKKSKNIKIKPLIMKSVNNKNLSKKAMAINEISILRQGRQTAKISIKKNNIYLIKKLISDGVLISTPAGSTAYNLSVHGPILDINSKKITVTPISPFRPRRWKGKILSESKKITIRNLDLTKRPISAVADNIEYRNIKTVKIEVSNKIYFNLLFDKNNSLEKKIKIEQIKKETGK